MGTNWDALESLKKMPAMQEAINDIVGDPGKDHRERWGFVYTDIYGNKRFQPPTKKTKWLPIELPSG